MKCSRWMAVCVDMLDHPVVGMAVPPPKPADTSKHAQPPSMAWLDLISSAAFQELRVPHKGATIVLTRGQFLAGRAHWAKRWNWGEQSVRSFFSRLVQNGMVEISNQSDGHLANVASICNYDTYQSRKGKSKPEEKPEPNQSLTSGQPEPNQNTTRTTKNTNEEEKEDASSIEILPAIVFPTNEGPEVAALVDGKIYLNPAMSVFWLTKFGGDFERLDLALIQAVEFIKENSSRTITVQVNTQLARNLSMKVDSDKRYSSARAASGQRTTKQAPTYRPSVSQIAQALQELEAERAL